MRNLGTKLRTMNQLVEKSKGKGFTFIRLNPSTLFSRKSRLKKYLHIPVVVSLLRECFMRGRNSCYNKSDVGKGSSAIFDEWLEARRK